MLFESNNVIKPNIYNFTNEFIRHHLYTKKNFLKLFNTNKPVLFYTNSKKVIYDDDPPKFCKF